MSESQRSRLTTKCGERSRLLGSAENKLFALRSLVKGFSRAGRKRTLFYCGEGSVAGLDDDGENTERVINKVSKMLGNQGWVTSRFTSKESTKDRTAIMSDFVNGEIDALVSIRVLDEGVDVPVCDKAFILASTRNRRQYIQRRGRVLRNAKGKDRAYIYDFVVLPALGSSGPAGERLKKAELERVEDFCLLAVNRFDVEKTIDRLGMRDG